MPPGLTVPFRKTAPFEELLEGTRHVLLCLLKAEIVPAFGLALPPANKHLSLEGQFLQPQFPGAYVTLHDLDGSMVDIHVFRASSGMILGCSSAGRSAVSDVLTAATAIAAAQLLDGVINDFGHYWLNKDEYSSEELLATLSLPESNRGLDFQTAIGLISKRQFQPSSYGFIST